MKHIIFTLVILLSLIAKLRGQWEILNEGEGTFNTFDFVNDDIGWIGGTWHGKVSLLKTEDGGETWYPLMIEGNLSLEMIDFIDESVGWAIGNEFVEFFTPMGYILKTMDGGQTWSLQKKTPSGFSLRSIQAISDSIAYVIGASVIFKTSNGGTNWIDISPRNQKNRWFETCHFFNNQIGLVTGYNESQQSVILRTNDGGMTWEEILVSEFDRIAAVQFIDDSTGFFSAKKPDQDSCSLYKTTDRLKNWLLIDQSHNITTFFYLDRDLACAIGSNSMMKSTDGGNTWKEKLDIGNLRLDKLYFWNDVGFSFYRSGNIIIGLAPAGRGTLIKSVDQGERWTIEKLIYDFQDVCFINKDRGFAAGGDLYMHLSGYGDMFVTDDGGKTWEVNFSTYQKIESCFFVNQMLGFVLSRVIRGGSSHIYKTTDSGKSWENILNAPVDGYYFEGLDICFANETNGWAVGEGRNLDAQGAIIIATRDGGKSWESSWLKKSTNEQQRLFLRKIHFPNENTGWAVGDDGLIVKYTSQDQWQQPTAITDLPLNNVFFIDENNGFISGGYWDSQSHCHSILLKTTNGGATWEKIPDAPYLINDIYFHDQQQGWAVGTDSASSGVILVTKDGGTHWALQVNRLTGSLTALDARENYLWAVGDNGLVLRADLTTAVDDDRDQHLPSAFELFQNYPNPFNQKTVIGYQLPVFSEVELNIYNLLGQKVVTLVSEKQPAGNFTVEWEASDFATGVYLYRLEAGTFSETRKLILIK